MTARLLAVALAVVFAPPAGRAADDDNPYKNVKVGDYATYKMTIKVAGQNLDGTVTQTVTAKTDKEATVETTGKVNGMDIPAQKQTIDLTKPFDPSKAGTGLPAGTEAKVEKGKEGKEKLKVGGKEYETNWTNYTVKAKAMGVEIESDVKVWMAKDVPMGVAKMVMNSTVAGMKMEMTMELSESGNKK